MRKTSPHPSPRLARLLAASYARGHRERQQRSRKPRVVVAAVQTAEGLLKPVYAESEASPSRHVAPGKQPAHRVKSGLPQSVAVATGRARDRSANAPHRLPAEACSVALRRLGSAILEVAVEDANGSKPGLHNGARLGVAEEARDFLAGHSLEWCIAVFGLHLDADAVRRAIRR